MKKLDFDKKSYNLSILDVMDEIAVIKKSGCDFVEIKIFIHNKEESSIVLRSQQLAEGLHFLLGQMLGK